MLAEISNQAKVDKILTKIKCFHATLHSCGKAAHGGRRALDDGAHHMIAIDTAIAAPI
jgi:hypothetical protein